MIEGLMTVRVCGFRCRAYHGVYPQELKTGGEFEINLEVTYVIDKKINKLSQTISYVDLLVILKKQMAQARSLLESVAMEAAAEIKQTYPRVVDIKLGIDKLQAPIEGLQGRVGINFHQKYSTK